MFTTKGINKHIQSIDFYLTLLVIVCRWRLFQNIISLFHRCNVTSTWQLPEDRQVISHAILLKTNSSIAIAKKVFLCPVLENILKKRKRVIITHLYCIWKQLQASSSLRRVSYTCANHFCNYLSWAVWMHCYFMLSSVYQKLQREILPNPTNKTTSNSNLFRIHILKLPEPLYINVCID